MLKEEMVIKPENYLKFQSYWVTVSAVGTMVWLSLASLVVMGKAAIGIEHLPMFEAFGCIIALLGAKMAFSGIPKNTMYRRFKKLYLTSILGEMLFTITVIYLLYSQHNLMWLGISVYAVRNMFSLLVPPMAEYTRVYEDAVLTQVSQKDELRRIRKKKTLFTQYGTIIGATSVILIVSWRGVSMEDFAIPLLIVLVIQNVFEIYLWYKYLR